MFVSDIVVSKTVKGGDRIVVHVEAETVGKANLLELREIVPQPAPHHDRHTIRQRPV